MFHIAAHWPLVLAKLLLTYFGERLVKLVVDWLIRYLADKFGLEG